MSATWTTYGRDQMLQAIVQADTYVAPTGWWLALCLITPRANDSGSQLVEPDPASGYARVTMPLGSVNWTNTGVDEYSNVAAYDFGTFSIDAGYVQGWAICDAAAIGTGNVWAVGSMVEQFVLAAGNDYTLDNLTLGLYD